MKEAEITRREKRGLRYIAAATVLCAIAITGVFGVLLYFGVREGSGFDLRSEAMRNSIDTLSFIVLGIALAASLIGWLFKFESEDSIKSRGVRRPVFLDGLERRLELGICLFDLLMMFTFLFLGIRLFIEGEPAKKFPLWAAISLAAALAVIWISQKQLKNILQRIKPDRRKNPRDENVIRDRMISYRSGYRTYKKVTKVLLAWMILLMLLTRFSSSTATALFVETGLVWILISALFRYESARIKKRTAAKSSRPAP